MYVLQQRMSGVLVVCSITMKHMKQLLKFKYTYKVKVAYDLTSGGM